MITMGAIYFVIYFLNFISASSYTSNDSPKWSSSYSLQGEISIPHAEVSEPFTAFFDNDSSNSRIEYYNGSTYDLQLSGEGLFGTFLNVVPSKSKTGENTLKCLKMDENNDFHIFPQQFLPDLSNFKVVTNKIESRYLSFNTWIEKWVQVNLITEINTVVTYAMWLYRKSNVTCPMKFEMNKFNSLFQSHFDGFSIVYKSFSPMKPHPHNFKVEALNCKSFFGLDVDYIYSINPMMEFINRYEAYVDSSFEEFQVQYNRKYNYGTEEHFNRKNNFLQNLRYIHSKNRANNGYTLAINQFADYSKEELKSMFRVREENEEFNGGYPFFYNENDSKNLPSEFDWRTYGAVTFVKDQLSCDSGWSFATTGTIEGAYFLSHNERKIFSEQALTDCNWDYGNNGCDGGESSRAFSWIKNYGLPTKNEYDRYYSEDGYCQIAKIPNGHRTKISSFVNITSFDEKALKIALVNHGPISISIYASLKSFIFYSSGVFYDQDCRNTFKELNHAALLIGYGTLNNEPYWLIKNSFSTSWGNAGYILLSRKNNNCGVLTNPIYVNL